MSPSADERRRFTRVAFHGPASLDVGIKQTPCEILDISLKGALVEVPKTFTTGEVVHCTLLIRLDDRDASIRMEGEIAHLQGTLVGVRCDEIDLESVAHLRRLVELNLGSDEALHRELAALVAERNW